jgi:toxin FitB
MFLLDTNVLSELRSRNRTDTQVAAWVDQIDASDLFLSAITILEIELGVPLLQHRDERQGAVLRAWIDTKVMPAFAGRILSVDAAVAQHCARLHVPVPRAERDALIAATAMVNRLTVVTRNVGGFSTHGGRSPQPMGGMTCRMLS